jgi:hypothetical protein
MSHKASCSLRLFVYAIFALVVLLRTSAHAQTETFCTRTATAQVGDACLAWASNALANAKYFSYPQVLEAFVDAPGISIQQRTRAKILLAAAYLETDRLQDLQSILTSVLGQDWDSTEARLAPYRSSERAIAWYALLKSAPNEPLSKGAIGRRGCSIVARLLGRSETGKVLLSPGIGGREFGCSAST